MIKKPLAAVAFAAGMTLAGQAALAQDTGSQGDVVATVNGHEIYQSDLISFIQSLPPQLQAQVQRLMPQILDQLVNNELASQAGQAAGLADDPDVKRQVARIENLIVGQTYMRRAIDKWITDDKMDAAYQQYLKDNPPRRELQARHILVKTEEEAKAVIAELDAGADFATLAKKHSTGPSGANGGELPPFHEGEMVKPFSDAAFAMEVGTYSKEPVKTQFGYHVILLEASRMTKPPAKADVEDKLRQGLTQQAVEAINTDLRKEAKIDIVYGKQQPDAAPDGGAGTDGGTGGGSGSN